MHNASNLWEVRCDRNAHYRAVLSLREAVVLAEVPEKRVRKDIETGVLTHPFVSRIDGSKLCTHWTFVFTLAAVYGNHYLTGGQRKLALAKVDGFREASNSVWRCTPIKYSCLHIELDKYLTLDVSKVFETVKPRVCLYTRGLGRIEEKGEILGGEAVFKGTRLSVAHIGKMFDKGETIENILDDYDYLTEDDVRFAQLYNRAHPPMGRPRLSSGAHGRDAIPSVA